MKPGIARFLPATLVAVAILFAAGAVTAGESTIAPVDTAVTEIVPPADTARIDSLAGTAPAGALPWWKRKWAMIGGGALGVLLLVAAIGGGGGDGGNGDNGNGGITGDPLTGFPDPPHN